jgi:cytochrome b subunit of formate dehydrogenase
MTSIQKLSKSQILNRLLDNALSPVARMRLFSDGIRTNNRIVEYEAITGDRGCLACGNCIDACPVVREKHRFIFLGNQRTSMALETIVGEECRRCFACVRSCPQVSKITKEYVVGFRRGEKIVHAAIATLIFCLAASGIFLYHYREVIPGWQQTTIGAFHVTAGILLLLMPLLYFILDPGHFKRALKNSFSFDGTDLTWLKRFGTYLVKPGRNPLPDWREFNPYHKFWFSYLTLMIPVLGLSGLGTLLPGAGGHISAGIHSFFALTVDLLILAHLYFKIIRRIFRDISDVANSYRREGHLHFPFKYDSSSRSGEKN